MLQYESELEISRILVEWYETYKRELPWRETRDPYIIWISEIILQQTRVVQGLEYFLRFTERFPDVASLAVAEEDEVLKYWQGLGYYSRARNLHAAAKSIMERFNGVFPENYKEVLSLKGIGSIRRRRSSPLLGTNRVRSWMEMCTGYFPVCLP